MRCAAIDIYGNVVNIIEANPEVDEIDDLLLIPAPNYVTKRYVWDGNNFEPSTELQAEMEAELAAAEAAVLQEALE